VKITAIVFAMLAAFAAASPAFSQGMQDKKDGMMANDGMKDEKMGMESKDHMKKGSMKKDKMNKKDKNEKMDKMDKNSLNADEIPHG
jgi:hypothetical protein